MCANHCHVYINCVKLVQVPATKIFYEFYIDDQLNWHKQIQHVQQKLLRVYLLCTKLNIC